jgi:hypothetical protein
MEPVLPRIAILRFSMLLETDKACGVDGFALVPKFETEEVFSPAVGSADYRYRSPGLNPVAFVAEQAADVGIDRYYFIGMLDYKRIAVFVAPKCAHHRAAQYGHRHRAGSGLDFQSGMGGRVKSFSHDALDRSEEVDAFNGETTVGRRGQTELLGILNHLAQKSILLVETGFLAAVESVGGIAADALEQVNSAHRKRSRLRKTISAQFAEGSLSWDKFFGLVDAAERTVLRNAALVANNVQSFDREGYAKALRRKDEQLDLYNQQLDHMREVIAANDSVILELGKLELELSKLEAEDVFEDNNQTVEELQALIDNTRYYH